MWLMKTLLTSRCINQRGAGQYGMVVHINKNDLPEQSVPFYAPEYDAKGSRACIGKALTEQLGFKENVLKELAWWH